MKKILLNILVLFTFLFSYSFAEVAFKYLEKNELKEVLLPDGSFGTAITFQDSILQTIFLGPNIERSVIIEFKTSPVKAYKNQKDFNYKENNRLIELVKAEQLRFINDLKNIISNKSKFNNPSLLDANFKINYNYKIAINGISLTTYQWVIDEIDKLEYVKKIHKVIEVKINDDVSNQVIKADSVWYNLGVTGEGVLIAIIDTGIDSSHTVLNNGKVIGGYNFVVNNSNFFDDHGHGTHCAGIAAANGSGLTGVAPNASLLGVKVLSAGGSGTEDQIIAGIEFALDPDGNPNTADGADIISMSLGGSGSPEDAMSTAVNNAVENGVFCAIAAGNNGSGLYTIQSPGCAKNAMTVGACDNNNSIAGFSSRGPNSNNFEIKPDVIAPGVNIYSSVPNNSFQTMSGTSMATPHVAGAAALLKQIHPEWTPKQIKSALMGTAYNVYASVWEQGSGRIDVYKAAQVKSILSPSSISFGLIPYSQDIWTKSDTLTLSNTSDEAKIYYLTAEHSIPYGFSYTIEPEEVYLDAYSNTEIIFTITVDNSVFPLSESNPPTYIGTIVAQTDNELIKTNFVFAKARMFGVSFDELPVMVVIHNRKYLNYTHIWKQYINQVVPQDTFDIVAFFHDTDGFSYLVKEGIIVQGDSGLNVFMSKSEARNNILFSYQDAYNNPIYSYDTGLLQMTFNYNYGFLTFGGMEKNLHFSDFSDSYQFLNLRNGFTSAGNSNYDSFTTSFSILNGMNYSDTIIISPNNSKKIKHKYNLNGLDDNYYFSDWVANNFLATAVTSSTYNSFAPPYEKNNYYRFAGNTIYWKQKSYTKLFADFSTEFLASPVIKMFDDNVYFLDFNKTDTIMKFANETDSIEINNSYPIFKSRTTNESNSIILNKVNYNILSYPSLFQDIYGYNPEKSLNLKLKNVYGDIIDSLALPNLLNNFYENTNVYPGSYELELEFDSSTVYDYTGKAKATLKFNTSINDKNPPYIKKLLFTADGKVKPFFLSKDLINMECVISDDYAVYSANFYYKNLNDENWLPIEATYNYQNNSYSASISAATLFDYYSFRIEALDFSSNELVYEINPAFLVRLSAPNLISPDSTVLQCINPTFIWSKLRDGVKFTLQVSKSKYFSNLIINQPIYDTSYTSEISLNYNKTYYWRVKAASDNYVSSWSEVWNFKTIPYTISLNAGWNVISSFVIPDNPNLDTMFNSIIDDLIVIRNTNAQGYYPHYNVNTIGNWNYKQGYRIYVQNPVDLIIYGTDATPETTQISLSAGWNLVAYLRKTQMPLEQALSSIYNNIRIIKNPAGQIALPIYGYNKIGNMLPDEGYWIYLNAPAVLVYPAN